MTEQDEADQDAPDPEEAPGSSDGDAKDSAEQDESAAPQSVGEDDEAPEEEIVEVGFEPVGGVLEGNWYGGNTIVVQDGDFIGSAGEGKRSAVPTADITAMVGELSESFVEPNSFPATVEAIEARHLALLVGAGCGNRATATVALHRTGHEPIVEIPGSLSVPDMVEAVKQVCKTKTAGVLVDSVDAETLTALAGFRLRHLHSSLPPKAAVVFTTRTQRRIAADPELPTIEGVPPPSRDLVEALAKRDGLDEQQRARCRETLALLPQPISPATAAQLVAQANDAGTAEELAAALAGESQALDEWLDQRPDARSLAALAAVACLDGVPSSDYDEAAIHLAELLEGEIEAPSEPPRFGPRERLWPAGLARYRDEQVATHFGWQETEIVEICPPHQHPAVVGYLWRKLGGEFRRPFLLWLLELPSGSSNRLAYAAARTAGILFACDPVAIEREVLRPWAHAEDPGLRNAAAFALGMPVMIGADPSSARRLVKQWSGQLALQEAAIAAYGGPLGIWDQSAAAPSHLWEVGWARPELQGLADRSLAALLVGGRAAGRARATTVGLLCARADTRAEAPRAYGILPLALRRLTEGRSIARDSLEGLLDDSERDTFASLAALMADAFRHKDGRDNARLGIQIVLKATKAGRIGRDVVERLIREMKTAASEQGRLPQLGNSLEQLLKVESRKRGPLRDEARSLHETFYDRGQGGRSLESA